MSVINMFRKEALRHQYKTQEFGHSVIKQPSIINQAIWVLCFVILIIVIFIKFITLTSTQSFNLSIAVDNYLPLVTPSPSIIKEQLVNETEQVDRNQSIYLLSNINETQPKQYYLRAPSSGLFFHLNTDSNISSPYKPIGFILKNNSNNEFSFWLKDKPKKAILVGDQVKVTIGEKKLEGKISMMLGNFTNQKGKKIFIKFKNSRDLSSLSPKAEMQLSLKQQPKSIAQLLN